MRIYVSGPTVKSTRDTSLPARIYRIIEKRLLDAHDVDLPVQTDSLSKLSPSEFYSHIQKKIELADGIFTLLLPDDQSTPIESATAAQHGKPQCIMAQSFVPRLIAGLPDVIEIVPFTEDKKLEEQVLYLIDRLLGWLDPKLKR